jgi:glycerol-3-phosphate O-acyltransferase
MIVDAGMKLRSRKVYFAPVSIGYERIVEQKSYVHELSGGDKEKENLGGLLRSTKVLRSKHGRVFVQFGEPLSLDDAIADMWSREQATPLDGDARDLKPRQRRTLVQRIAHQVVYEINRATVATPAAVCATALLIHRRRGITQPELLDVADRVVRALQSTGARLADTLLDEGGLIRADTLEEAIQLFIDSGLVTEQDHRIYSVAQERRIELEFYKNNLLHFFVPRALISSALLANTENTVSRHTLRERVRQLSRLFKYEFMYRADATFEEIFDEALESMLQQGDVDELADHIKIGNTSTQQRLEEARQSDLPPPPPTLGLIRSAGMIRTYFESSLLTLRAIQTLGTDASSKKDWVKETLRLGHRMHLAGTLELRESVSKPKIENALQALRDHGLLRFSDAGQKIEISPEANETDTIERLEALLLSFLQ